MTYHFAELFSRKGWYPRYTDELWNFDWNATSGNKSSMPVGVAPGKVFSIGKRPVNLLLGGNYLVKHRTGDAKWGIKLNVTLLFPE